MQKKVLFLILGIILVLPLGFAAFDASITEISVLGDDLSQKANFLAGETFFVKIKVKNLGDDLTYGRIYLKCEYAEKPDSYPCKGDGFYYKYNPTGKQIELKKGEEITFFAQGKFYDKAWPTFISITAFIDPEGILGYDSTIKKTVQVSVQNNADWEALKWENVDYCEKIGYPIAPPTTVGQVYCARIYATILNPAKPFSAKYELQSNNKCSCYNLCAYGPLLTFSGNGKKYYPVNSCTLKTGKNCIYMTAKDSAGQVLAGSEYCTLSAGYTPTLPAPNTTPLNHAKVNVIGDNFSDGTISCNYISDKKQYECTAKLTGYRNIEFSFDKQKFNDPANLQISAEPAEMFAYKKGSVNIYGNPNNGARKYIFTLIAADSETVSGADFGIMESLAIILISLMICLGYVRRTQKSFSDF